jgi:hypothetical protein
VTQRGMALVVVVLTMVLVMAAGAALVLTTSSEALIASNFKAGQQALYAADGAAEWALADLPAVAPDWPTLLNTTLKSWFVDGLAAGQRALADGSVIDLTSIVTERAAWKPYAFGPLKDLLPPVPAGFEPSAFYVIVFVAADPAAVDRLKVRTEAFGPRGAHKVVEMKVLRDAAGVHPMAWTEVR